MIKPIPALIVVAGVAAGGTAGAFLKASNAPTPAPAEQASEQKSDTGHAAPKSSDHTSKSGSYDKPDSAASYFKFSREFVVPIMRDGTVQSLVILNINLEVDDDASLNLFSMEPKLRDNIMTTLVALSTDGRTFETMTTVDSYESIRAVVLANLSNVTPKGIRNVLILDAAKQDL